MLRTSGQCTDSESHDNFQTFGATSCGLSDVQGPRACVLAKGGQTLDHQPQVAFSPGTGCLHLGSLAATLKPLCSPKFHVDSLFLGQATSGLEERTLH